jgi:hypothetical protein
VLGELEHFVIIRPHCGTSASDAPYWTTLKALRRSLAAFVVEGA